MTAPAAARNNKWGDRIYPVPRPGTLEMVELPSVTGLLNVIAKPGLEKWKRWRLVQTLALRPDWVALAGSGDPDAGGTRSGAKDVVKQAEDADQSAANKGTGVHYFAEQVDNDTLIWEMVPEPIKPAVAAYAQAKIDHGWQVIRAEFTCYSHTYGYAGTADQFTLWPKFDDKVHTTDIKGLALDTPLPTPRGWTTMGAIQPGDQLFGSNGKICEVLYKSEVKNLPCYRVIFDDASSIICDEEHRWAVVSGQNPNYVKHQVLTAKELAATVFGYGTRTHSQRQHRILNAAPLELPEADVVIPPYVLGAWLGDGTTSGGSITGADAELFDHIAAEGYGLSSVRTAGCVTRTVYNLRTQLRLYGLLDNKHVPDDYLRGSIDQRLALLQGLMDTDGTYNKARRSVSFTSTLEGLAAAVFELAVSLGQRARMRTVTRTGFGKTVQAFLVTFTPNGLNPFRLSRKAKQVHEGVKPTARSSRRLIVSVEPVQSTPTQCIAVDSYDHTYLCGEQMVPTHNTSKSVYADYALQLGSYTFADGIWVPGATPKADEALAQLDRDIKAGVNIPPTPTGKTRSKWTQAAIKAAEAEVQELYWDEYATNGEHFPLPENLCEDVAFITHVGADYCHVVPLHITGLRPAVAGLAALGNFLQNKLIVGEPISPFPEVTIATPAQVAPPVDVLADVEAVAAHAEEEAAVEPTPDLAPGGDESVGDQVRTPLEAAPSPVSEFQPEPPAQIPVAPQADLATRIQVYRERIGALPIEAKRKLAFGWPAGVPTFKQSTDHTETQLALIDALLWEVECEFLPASAQAAATQKLANAFPGSAIT